MRSVRLSGADEQMDCRGSFDEPLNMLPRKCPACGFPDLDYVAQPYFLVKSRTMTPDELALATFGNLLVRGRVRQVLEIVAPGQCTYFPTVYKGTTDSTAWFLAVPKYRVLTAKVDPKIPRCGTCGEPTSAHPGTQWSEMLFGSPIRNQLRASDWTDESERDVFKSSTWGSSERSWNRWITRDLFMSVRLFHLF